MLINLSELHIIIIDNAVELQGLLQCRETFGEGRQLALDVQGESTLFHTIFGTVIYCHSGENLGYAKGNNLGTEIADICFNDDFYLISNNDLRIQDKIDWNHIRKIFIENEHVAVIGPRVLGPDGRDQSPHKKIKPFRHLIAAYWIKYFPVLWKGGDYDSADKSKICYRVMGCFMFIKSDIFKKVGKFDPNTFMYSEEPILSEKLMQEKYYFYFDNTTTIIHEHGASVNKTTSVKRSEQWSFDSLCYYYEKYRGVSRLLISMARINFRIYLFFLPLILKARKIKRSIKG